MLHISFRQFRCWENLVLNIPLGCITLIKGRSGQGKSTVLQGIIWCLYGNIRSVSPNQIEPKTKVKTQVIIQMPYNFNGTNDILTITRQKNPNQFILSHNQKSYEDKVAQSIIDNMFGTYDIFVVLSKYFKFY